MPILHHTYPNGFRVIYENSFSRIPISSAFIVCDMGSVYEYDKMRGASHFIEHMCFKGTKKIPDSNDIFAEYSKIGAYFNAFTDRRYTCYTVKCQDEYLEHSLQVVSDMLMNSTFKKSEFVKEHKVIIEENNNNENNPENVLNDEVNKMLYRGSSYEHQVDDLTFHHKNSLDYNDILDFYRVYYHPSNMILSIVSHLPFEHIKAMIKTTYFHKNPKRVQPSIVPVIQFGLLPYTEIQYKMIEKKGISNTLISIGFRTCPRSSIDKYILILLSKIMGGGFSSRLMKLLREKKGLVYHAKCTAQNYEHMGEIVFFTVTKPANFFSSGKKEGVLSLMMKTINSMKKEGITEEEIRNAKGYIKGSNVLNLESLTTQTQYNGEEWLMGDNVQKIVPYSKLYETYYHNITKADVTRVINQYIIPQNMCVCIVNSKPLALDKVKHDCETLI